MHELQFDVHQSMCESPEGQHPFYSFGSSIVSLLSPMEFLVHHDPNELVGTGWHDC